METVNEERFEIEEKVNDMTRTIEKKRKIKKILMIAGGAIVSGAAFLVASLIFANHDDSEIEDEILEDADEELTVTEEPEEEESEEPEEEEA